MNPSGPIRRQKPPTPEPAGKRAELLSPRMAVIAALCLMAAVFAVYWSSLEFQFILDDHRFVNDPRVQSSGHVWDYFANYVWAQFTGGPSSFYRPVFILWMRVNFVLNDLSPWGWHLLSIMNHTAVALLLGLLAWRLLRDRAAGLLAATLFALHPAQTESVAWVTVPDPLMSIGILGSLLLYLRYADCFSHAGARRWKEIGQGGADEANAVSSVVVDCVRECGLGGSAGKGNCDRIAGRDFCTRAVRTAGKSLR